jgi:hypothetical protein
MNHGKGKVVPVHGMKEHGAVQMLQRYKTFTLYPISFAHIYNVQLRNEVFKKIN